MLSQELLKALVIYHSQIQIAVDWSDINTGGDYHQKKNINSIDRFYDTYVRRGTMFFRRVSFKTKIFCLKMFSFGVREPLKIFFFLKI